jgi:hypothetical protein
MLLHLTPVFRGDMPDMPDLTCNIKCRLTGVARLNRDVRLPLRVGGVSRCPLGHCGTSSPAMEPILMVIKRFPVHNQAHSLDSYRETLNYRND